MMSPPLCSSTHKTKYLKKKYFFFIEFISWDFLSFIFLSLVSSIYKNVGQIGNSFSFLDWHETVFAAPLAVDYAVVLECLSSFFLLITVFNTSFSTATVIMFGLYYRHLMGNVRRNSQMLFCSLSIKFYRKRIIKYGILLRLLRNTSRFFSEGISGTPRKR